MKKIFYFYLIIISFLIPVKGQYKILNTEKLIGEEGQIFMSPVWSPDGSMIAFTSSNYIGIWVIDLSTNSIKQITNELSAGYKMKWSANSEFVLTKVSNYEGLRKDNAIKVYNISSGEQKVIVNYGTIKPGFPYWSETNEKVYVYNNGRLLTYNSGIKNNKTNIDKKPIIFLKDDKIGISKSRFESLEVLDPINNSIYLDLEVSPDGSKIVFKIYGGDMYVMNVGGSGLTNLGKGHQPKWSPDNQYIIYMITEDDGHQILSSDIYTIKIDGTEKTNLTNAGDKLEMNPSWSPDGKKIAYDVLDEGAIYLMEISK